MRWLAHLHTQLPRIGPRSEVSGSDVRVSLNGDGNNREVRLFNSQHSRTRTRRQARSLLCECGDGAVSLHICFSWAACIVAAFNNVGKGIPIGRRKLLAELDEWRQFSGSRHPIVLVWRFRWGCLLIRAGHTGHGAHRIRATSERERGIWVLFHVQIRA